MINNQIQYTFYLHQQNAVAPALVAQALLQVGIRRAVVVGKSKVIELSINVTFDEDHLFYNKQLNHLFTINKEIINIC
jgi:hypothetical protein